ncbi:50S ribosomal protein L32 [Candidatus Karelsulcia muelleri]|uniref:50S ribosomal protein L32 n=1 Tax=Candidatus Karelsulcia muelleri TaxID=336810 RepID=UPI001951BC78|nr:50S ribosomal protein L32 [Candidatus Karelsulcia muelleri]
MAHPKKRKSKSKTRKRRNSKKLEIINLYKDKLSKQFHVYHRGLLIDKTIYYKGRVFKRKTIS